MLPTYILAAMHFVSFDDGVLRFLIPPNAQVTRRKVNFEMVEYDIRKHGERAVLVTIIDGGGANVTKDYRKICLNGRQAWERVQPKARNVVVGVPGIYTVNASYYGLTAQQSALADRILRSIHFSGGAKCSP